MLQQMLKAKIHRARVTDANLNYEGSLTIDRQLMDAVGLLPFEYVEVYNINNGERFGTYVIEGAAGSGTIALNGAAARKGEIGDLVIIVSYALYSLQEMENYQPRIVVVDQDNRVRKSFDAQHLPPI